MKKIKFYENWPPKVAAIIKYRFSLHGYDAEIIPMDGEHFGAFDSASGAEIRRATDFGYWWAQHHAGLATQMVEAEGRMVPAWAIYQPALAPVEGNQAIPLDTPLYPNNKGENK